MKQFLALLLALLLLTGCAAKTPAEESIPADEPTAEVSVEETPAEEAPAEEPSAEETHTEEAPAEDAPTYFGEFSAQTLAGETLDQTYFSNTELTIVNVWATYCGPCKTEMPVLGKLDREMDNVQVLGIVTDVINQKGEPDETQVDLALDLLTSFECDYPNLILNQSLAYLGFANLQAVPATLFVDSEGNLVGLGFYGALDEDGWQQAIAERLEMVSND